MRLGGGGRKDTMYYVIRSSALLIVFFLPNYEPNQFYSRWYHLAKQTIWSGKYHVLQRSSEQILNIQYIRRSAHLNSQVDNPEVGEDEGVLLDVKLHLQLEDKN